MSINQEQSPIKLPRTLSNESTISTISEQSQFPVLNVEHNVNQQHNNPSQGNVQNSPQRNVNTIQPALNTQSSFNQSNISTTQASIQPSSLDRKSTRLNSSH